MAYLSKKSKAFYEGVKTGATHEEIPNPHEEGSKEWWDWNEGNGKAYELFLAEEIIGDLSEQELDQMLSEEDD